MDNVVRSNDRVAFACVFKKAALHPPDVGSYVDGVPISSDRDDQLRKQAELLDKKRCDVSCARFVEDAKAMGVASVVADVLPAGGGGGGGSVVDVLERYIISTSADLVIVGSRGVGALHGSLLGLVGLGSVSEGLLNKLKVPTLVVKLALARDTKSTSGSSDDVSTNGTKGNTATQKERRSAASRDDDVPAEGGFARGWK
jgi:hypothetical protein